MRPTRTWKWTIGAGLAAFVALGASGQGQVASEEEARQVAEEHSRTMKTLGRAMRILKGFTGSRGTAEEASTAAVIADAAPAGPVAGRPPAPAGTLLLPGMGTRWRGPAGRPNDVDSTTSGPKFLERMA